jgi:ABC-type Fe3+/spermidine/putrescine transport system ATPase subunit
VALTVLSVRGLHLQVGSFRVTDVSLDVAEGEYFVLMGPTGSGKSLTARCVAGLIAAKAGTVTLDGRDVTNLEPRRRGVGYMPQHGALFPHLDVAENVAFALRVRGARKAEIRASVAPLVKLLGLEELLQRRVGTLSGGERQKVALARALASRPRLLLLDEPLSALDEPSRREIGDELRRVQRSLGIATIHICHNTEEARSLADRVGVMHAGHLVQKGPLEQLQRQPADAAVARLLGVETGGR